MADRLTQFQDCLDDVSHTITARNKRKQLTTHTQLATQMFASIRYIQTRHAFAPIKDQPDMSDPTAPATTAPLQPSEQPTQTLTASAQESQQQPQNPDTETAANADATDSPPGPDDPDVFKSALRELARDLVLKEQQIEYLISVLPGIGESEDNQNQRIRVLEKELRDADEQRREALGQREAMLDTLSQLAGECKRVY